MSPNIKNEPQRPLRRRHGAAAWSLLTILLMGLAVQAAASPAPDLEDLESLLNKPVYAASKYVQGSASAPATVSVITAGEIRTFGWRTLAEALSAVRGVAAREDRQYSYLGLRGFAPPGDYSSRVLLLVDGMRVNDNLYDGAVIGREFPVDLDMVERIEVISGPGSSLYGSNAIQAVVNVVTLSAAQSAGSRATLGVGSNRARRLSALHGLRSASGGLLLGIQAERRPGTDHYYTEFDAPPSTDGWARGLDAESARKFFGKWTHDTWVVSLLASDRKKTIPTASYGADFGVPAFSRDSYAFLNVQNQRELGGSGRLYARANVVSYEYEGQGSYDSQSNNSYAIGNWLNAELRWQFTPWQHHVVVAGVEWQSNLRQDQRTVTATPDGDVAFEVSTSGHRYGLFVNDEWRLNDAWTLSLGARSDRLLNGKTNLAPRLGVVWTPAEQLHIKWLQGRAFREPNAYELYYRDDVGAGDNPQLGLEKLAARELAVDWRVRPNLRLAASAFRSDISGLIQQVLDPVDGQLRYQNVGAAQAEGLEVEAEHIADNGWRTRASLVRQRVLDPVLGADVVNTPRTVSKLLVNGPLPLPGWRVGAEVQHVSERLNAVREPVSGYSVLNATVQWLPAGRPYSVGLTVRNLTKRQHADPSGPEHVQRAIARDGRTWMLETQWAF